MRASAAFRAAALAGALCFAAAEAVSAQRTRFPGDSPTRPEAMGGRVLGTPSGRRPDVPTFTIPQGGFRTWPPVGGCYPWGYGRYYPYYGGWYGRTLWLPPVYVNAGTWFGPSAATPLQVQPHVAAAARRRAAIDPVDRLPDAPEVEEGPTASELKRAWRYIDYGDRHLREGRPREAYSRYRKAIDAAPQLADAHLRRGLAELAMGNIGRSATALREGLRLNPDWPHADFQIKDLIEPRTLDEAVRALAERLDKLPNDADARLLAGVVLHFNGEADAAREHFQRVVKVTGGSEAARAFLPVQPEAEDAAALIR